MKAGESCLFDSRLLHASERNDSNSDRVAAFFSLIPEDQPIRLYFRNPEIPARLDVFRVDSEFLLRFNPLEFPGAAQRESMVLLGSFKHPQKTLVAADFDALHADADVTSSLWTKLWRRFR